MSPHSQTSDHAALTVANTTGVIYGNSSITSKAATVTAAVAEKGKSPRNTKKAAAPKSPKRVKKTEVRVNSPTNKQASKITTA